MRLQGIGLTPTVAADFTGSGATPQMSYDALGNRTGFTASGFPTGLEGGWSGQRKKLRKCRTFLIYRSTLRKAGHMTADQPSMIPYDSASILDSPLELDELRRVMLEPAYEHCVREHAYYRYWKTKLGQPGDFDEHLLNDLLETCQGEHPLGDIVGRLCVSGRISLENAQKLISRLDPDTYAYKQVRAYILLSASPIQALTTIEEMLRLKTDWATEQVIQALKPGDHSKAQDLIASSNRPRRSKQYLLTALQRAQGEEVS